MGVEYELKYAASEEAQEKILAALPGRWQTIRMETTYFDTPTGALSARRWTLRCRLENGNAVCTVKTPVPGGGRGEWDCQSSSIENAVPMLCKLGGPAELEALAAEGLVPICGARFTRRALLVELEECTLEIALDSGVLMGKGQQLPLCEVEVELKSGSKAAVAAFAAGLAERFGLTPEGKSKFKRALDLTKGD